MKTGNIGRKRWKGEVLRACVICREEETY